VQYREVEGLESPRFLSYFPRFYSMHGGVSTGFRHVTEPPTEDIRRLYRVNLSRVDGRSSLVVREIAATANNLVEGDVYVFDKGQSILQFNAKGSAGQERFRAAEFVQSLANERKGQAEVTVYGQFWLNSLG
jgi:gelsolin